MKEDEVKLNEKTLLQRQERENARSAAEVTADFERRREERRSIESGWILNINFLSGNQYCDVSPIGDVVEEDPQFYWQSRRVFNHIAPTVESRIAKLEHMRPELTVRAFSDEDGDVKAAQLATGILRYVQDRIGLQELSSRATTWSETCGSSFFKVDWNAQGGRQVGVDEDDRPIYEGEVRISVVPPFEIFPDRLDVEEFAEVQSVIHARAVPVSYVEEKFVKQDCLRLPGAFFGVSIIDRLIPVQRAYNAVKNRKYEFLNRLSMGVLTVEDGSIDTDELSEEGLLPGKVLVYRQGGKPPEMLDCGSMPREFQAEEELLEEEFAKISGVSDLAKDSTPVRVTSATGLQLLLSQDESRLSATVKSIERALKEVGRQILRLYRQFAGTARLMTLTGENKKSQVYYFNASGLDVNDLQFESRETVTPAEKKNTLLSLYEAGLLTDERGNLTQENKNRILEAFGFGSYENARDISALHIAKAGEENLDMKSGEVEPDVYDDHALHITEHTRFLLSADFKRCRDRETLKRRYVAHLEAHKALLRKETAGEAAEK